MKTLIKITLTLLAILYMESCKKDNVVVTYPESFPTIVTATVAEASIVYGDSITLSVNVSDVTTPLSTLEIQVVVNNSVITSESVRTKDNNATVEKRYKIPFGPNCPDNEIVKVYLSSINVSGFQTDTIIGTTVAKRPEIDELWLVPTTGKSAKLELIDSVNLIYKATGLDYGTSVTFKIASKVDKFKKVDWSGFVFGAADNGIGLIDQTGQAATIEDATIIGISEFTFDAVKFEAQVGGKLLEPATTLDINADLPAILLDGKNFLGGNAYFGEGVEVTFTGITDLANNLAPDYFEVTGTNTAKFTGATGLYKAYYYIDGGYLYIEPEPEVIYPDAIWMCGTGFGRPSAPYATTASWNWNSPLDYAPCRLVSAGLYQVTVYGKNEDKGGTSAGFGTFDFKFFYKRGWWDADHEIEANTYTVTPAPFFGRTDQGNIGNMNGGPTSFDGVFRITVDMNAKTINVLKIN
jgi:hypothetical protein